MGLGEKPSVKPQADHQTWCVRRRFQVRCLWISRELGCPEKAGGPRALIGGRGTRVVWWGCGAGEPRRWGAGLSCGRRGWPAGAAGGQARLRKLPEEDVRVFTPPQASGQADQVEEQSGAFSTLLVRSEGLGQGPMVLKPYPGNVRMMERILW